MCSRRAWLAVLLLLLGSCLGTRDARTGPSQPVLAELRLPALALAPPDTAYFVAVRRLSGFAESIRSLIGTLRALDANLTAEQADQALRRELGASPLQALDLEDMGLDPTADAALFSTGISPTFVFKIGDDEKLTKFLGERTKSSTTYHRSHRDIAVTSWNQVPEIRGSFLRLRGYLVVHLEHVASGQPSVAPQRLAGSVRDGGSGLAKVAPSLDWLDQIIDAAAAGRGPAALSWAVGAAGDQRDVVAFIDPERVALAAAGLNKERHQSCADGDKDIAKVRRIAFGAGLRPQRLHAVLKAELQPSAIADLRRHVSDGPRLPSALWDQAPARVEWQLDPTALASWGKHAFQSRCGPVQALLVELRGLLDVVDRNQSVLEHVGRGLSAALLAADEKGQGTLLLRGAVIGRAPDAGDRAFLERQLSLRPDEEKIAGRRVRGVNSSLTLAEPVYIAFTDGLLRLAAGDGVMERLLSPQRREGRGQRLLSFELQPGKIADLRAAMKLVDEPAPPAPALPSWQGVRRSRSDELNQLAAWLASFASLKASAALIDQQLTIDAEYVLR